MTSSSNHETQMSADETGAGLSRRRFIQGAGLAAVSVSMTSLPRFLVSPAAAQTGPRTLVCLFLAGGADSFAMYLPRDHAEAGSTYADLQRVRGQFVPSAGSLLPIGDGSFGLNPGLGNLAEMANQDRVAVVRNVGPLVRPTTPADVAAGRSIPQDLFAHDAQQKQWQTARPVNSADQGWGDSITAAIHSGSALYPSFSINGNSRWASGSLADYTGLSPNTSVKPLIGYDWSRRRWIPSFEQVESIMTNSVAAAGNSSNVLDQAAANVIARSTVASRELEQALNQRVGDIDMGDVQGTPLGAQLRRVAVLIHNREMLGMSRQVFFVRLGGWDTHRLQLEQLPILLNQFDRAVGSFYRALDGLGLSDSVTTFTASDFGRTLTINGDGTDHGWGGHSFVMGGAVRGGDYGTFPSFAVNNNPDDIPDRNGNFSGRIVPTTSVSQYGATLARWMGVPDSRLATAFPELSNFSESNLGFL